MKSSKSSVVMSHWVKLKALMTGELTSPQYLILRRVTNSVPESPILSESSPLSFSSSDDFKKLFSPFVSIYWPASR